MAEEPRRDTLPQSFAETTPRGLRSFDEMNTGQMVFELQGTVGEIKEAVAALSRSLETSEKRLEIAERTSADIKEILKALIPKIDDIVGFTKHAAPNFATKADIEKLDSAINKRPTRWQAVVDFALIAGLAGALLTLGSHIAK
ncbi:MAG: hypothetical protein K8R18_11560 [Parvibaculum sp.]|uniref:hypothetical protein n=1 Tax=Parvibaculum sp. TaxID=2024848 RepID=UPI0026008188|nr:hypothetical protein [Parvibaculum sp.]MCE9650247.1 hypothetical protein [Parvibaculum sp.]